MVVCDDVAVFTDDDSGAAAYPLPLLASLRISEEEIED